MNLSVQVNWHKYYFGYYQLIKCNDHSYYKNFAATIGVTLLQKFTFYSHYRINFEGNEISGIYLY